MWLKLLSFAFRLIGAVSWAEALEERMESERTGEIKHENADLKATVQGASDAVKTADRVHALSDADLNARLGQRVRPSGDATPRD